MSSEFTHAYWIGGSPCAGKSTIAQRLAAQYSLHLYQCDTEFEHHLRQSTAEASPTIHHLHQLSCDELWLRPVTEQLNTEIAYHAERFELILADLCRLPTEPVLVEGAELMPTAVFPLLTRTNQAIWLVPTADFQRHHYAQRPWIHEVLRECSQPAQAFENWMQRDIAYANWVQQETTVRNLNCLIVDGSHSIEENCQRVAESLQLPD
ncbi:hypothetical protein [Candidatus Leptofilum sp.]|uniref:hypothetical protein n=1 Tax=Candidatus Leptofilum sp. TaxID=3241576 RepID=UPI003B5B1BF7